MPLTHKTWRGKQGQGPESKAVQPLLGCKGRRNPAWARYLRSANFSSPSVYFCTYLKMITKINFSKTVANCIFQRWQQQYFPSYILFLQCDVGTPPMERWGLPSLPLNHNGEVRLCDLRLGQRRQVNFHLIDLFSKSPIDELNHFKKLFPFFKQQQYFCVQNPRDSNYKTITQAQKHSKVAEEQWMFL